MNFRKISTIALVATSMALLSCSGSEYAKVKKWVEDNYKMAGTSAEGIGGIEIFDFRKTTDRQSKVQVCDFLNREYKNFPPESVVGLDNLYGFAYLSEEFTTEDIPEPYFKSLELLNAQTFNTIIAKDEQEFKDGNCVVYYQGDTIYFEYDDVEEGLEGSPKIRAAEEFDENGIEIADYYFYDIGNIKGTITTIFFPKSI